MKRKCKQLMGLFKNWNHTQSILKAEKFAEERKKADIIRLVHSIEKGLCLENPHLGFGVQKINTLLDYCDEYIAAFGKESICLMMVQDALEEYIEFHKDKNFDHPDFIAICKRFDVFSNTSTEEKYGGTLLIKTNSSISFDELEYFFSTRHSIRDFQPTDVPKESLLKAIKAAQLAPSACNRQAVRTHIMSSKKLCALYGNKMDGIGGFAENANKFILITGKVSAYQAGEYNQHIVSASIFATYLVLSLQALQIGSCIIQRPLYYSKQWETIVRTCNIPEDEQLVLMIAIGNMKPSYRVPVSKRFSVEEITTFYRDED